MAYGGLLLVALVQACIYAFQACYMSRGLEVTRQSAEAATKSATVAEMTMRVTQLADLAVQGWKLERFQEDGMATAIVFGTNAGQTRATIIESFTKWLSQR